MSATTSLDCSTGRCDDVVTATAEQATFADSELRRSIRNLGLRWQARLEGNGPDRALPWGLALVLFIGFGALSLARFRSLELGTPMASWMQGLWLVSEDRDPYVTLTERNLFDGQLSIIMWPIAKLSCLLYTSPSPRDA